MTKGDRFFIFRLNLNMALGQIWAGLRMMAKTPKLLKKRWRDLT